MFFSSIKEINRLLNEINRLISKGMSNIYLKVTIEKKWRTQNFNFLSLKSSSHCQFLRSSNSRRYYWIFLQSCCNLKRTWGQNCIPVFMAYFCYFHEKRAMNKVLWRFGQISWSYKVTKFWRHTRECTKHFTAGFLWIYLLLLCRKSLL